MIWYIHFGIMFVSMMLSGYMIWCLACMKFSNNNYVRSEELDMNKDAIIMTVFIFLSVIPILNIGILILQIGLICQDVPVYEHLRYILSGEEMPHNQQGSNS